MQKIDKTQEREYNKKENEQMSVLQYASIVKWISHKSSKLRSRVQIPVEAPKCHGLKLG